MGKKPNTASTQRGTKASATSKDRDRDKAETPGKEEPTSRKYR